MRLIDADKLIKSIDGNPFTTDSVKSYIHVSVAKMPTIEPERKGEWIPVSERPPEKNGVYIVSYEDAVTWLEWFNGKWFFYPSNPAREETGTIIAWMPLPEAYKGE